MANKAYNLGPNAARGLKRLLQEAKRYAPADSSLRRSAPDVPSYAAVPTFWQVKWDNTNGWLVRVAETATSINGIHVHDEPVTGETEWFKIANAPGGTAEGVFAVNVHIKRRVKVGSGGISECVFVSASAAGEAAPGVEPANYSAGDIYTIHVATCTTTAVTGSSGTTYSHTVHRKHRESVDIEAKAPSVLELYWAVPTVSSSGWTTFTPHTPASISAPICGGNLADTALPAANAVTVWYLVDCTGQSPAPSVETTQTAADGKIYVDAWTLSNGCVTEDRRAKLANAVFYP